MPQIKPGIFMAAAILLVAAARSPAQTGCLKGTVLMGLGVNGKITVCPQYETKVPGLQEQLTQLQRTVSGNEELLRAMRHTARSVNTVAQNVDADRQVQLLRSLSHDLQQWVTEGQSKTANQIAELADKLDTLQDSIAQSKEDSRTAQQTLTALTGQLGEAIAKLDLTNAQQQLDAIRAKLDSISDDTQHIRQAVDEENKRQAAAAEEERKKAEEMDKDPNFYTRAQIMPSRSPVTGKLQMMIFFYSRPPLYPPFIDSQLSIAFRKGAAAWRVDAADKQVSAGGELWQLSLDEAGDHATVCFVAHDKQSGELKEWTQRYKITPANSPAIPVNFIPEGDPAMQLTKGRPCDGVTEVRLPAKEPPPATPGAFGTSGAGGFAGSAAGQNSDMELYREALLSGDPAEMEKAADKISNKMLANALRMRAKTLRLGVSARAQTDVSRAKFAGNIEAQRGNYSRALPLYRQAAEGGDSEATVKLAYLYYNGWGVAQDYPEAAKWFQKAADAGETKAMSALGLMYAMGRGVEQNDRLAAEWDRKAAANGDAMGMLGLGFLYQNGRGVPRDLNEAAKWYRKAAALGDQTAADKLRNMGLQP